MPWDDKWILKSKTLWLNVLALGVGWLLQHVDAGVISDPYWLIVMTSILNIMNRFLTEQGVSLFPPRKV